MFPRRSYHAILWLVWSVAVWAAAAQQPSARPSDIGSLQILSKAVLEEKSASQRRRLEEFAERHQGQIPGVLARLALGYAALQGKQYAEAGKQFELAARTPTLLQDYAVYYQAVSAAALANHAAAAKLLEGFPERYPASVLAGRAVMQVGTSLIAAGRPAEVVALLAGSRVTLPEPDATYLLAQAYHNQGRLTDAVAAFRKVYYNYPSSTLAAEAERSLKQLAAKMGSAYPSATAAMWQTRADKFYDAGRWSEAQSAYRTLSTLAQGSVLDRARVRVGVAQFQLGATWPALNTLQQLEVSDPEADAERIYTLAAAYRRLGRQESMEQQVALLEKRYPNSEWREKALVLAGNYYLLQKAYDRAGGYYRKTFEEFPQGETAATGHWKVTWQAYRERRWAEAKQLLEEHIRNFPASPQLPAALYWLGRLVERESAAAAVPFYQKVTEAFPNYYYGLLARQRLADLSPAATAAAVKTISLDHIQRNIAIPASGGRTLANEAVYRERVRLLESAWLMEWAIDEMRAVVAQEPAATWAGSEMARLEKERGRYHLALRYAKRYVPSYFARPLSELSRDVWELLFPRPWWEQVKKQAAAAQVDPYLVAGLIRQESEYDPQARSRSNARGLMQLLPSTAQMMARQVPDPKARRYRLSALYVPDINLVYGTFYLKKVLDQFNGTAEYALAGYNAGENRVAEWLRNGPFEEPAEFVESIPFTETREYVQAVLRNAAVYRELYPEEP